MEGSKRSYSTAAAWRLPQTIFHLPRRYPRARIGGPRGPGDHRVQVHHVRGRGHPVGAGLQPRRPGNEQRRADAAFVAEVLVEVERGVADALIEYGLGRP